jgi:sphinganine C4-monooxygenase
MLGTVWTGGDVSARYERSRIAAQKQVDAETHFMANSSAADSATNDHRPYENDVNNARELKTAPPEHVYSVIPAGKAGQQAADSREQLLEDTKDDGAQVLVEEAEEEKEARSMIRKSNRRRTASSLTQSDSLRGLRERVTIHGRTGGILGMGSR